MKSLIIALTLCLALPTFAQDTKAEPKKDEAPKVVKRAKRIKAKAVAPASQPTALVAAPVTPKAPVVTPVTPKVTPKALPVATPLAAPKAEVKTEAPVTQQVWWQFLVQNLMQLGFFAASAMLSILISVLARKYKLEGVADRLQDLTYKAIHFAEQKTLSVSKLNPGAPLTPSAEKMKMAVEFAAGMAKSYKVPELAEAEWEKVLESALGAQRDVVSTPTPTNGKKE